MLLNPVNSYNIFNYYETKDVLLCKININIIFDDPTCLYTFGILIYN